MLLTEKAGACHGTWTLPGAPESGDEATVTAEASATLAERIDYLFRTVHPGRSKPYSIREAADEVNAAAGEQVISHSYLWALRKGRKTNPSMIQVAALAAFFGVSPMYFFDAPGDPLDPRVKLALSENAVRKLTLRAHGLDERTLQALTDMADNARTLAGLPPAAEPAARDETP
jgi:hypothetical protein